MPHSTKQILIVGIAFVLLIGACATTTPISTQSPEELMNQVATMVATTLTSMPDMATSTGLPLPTDTSLPPPTEAGSPTSTFPPPTLAIPSATPTMIPQYACDVINQRPYDDTKIHPNEKFVIKWTIVNIGTKKWQDGTVLQYSDGPQMTKVTSIDMPNLKPGEQHEVTVGAVAPAEKDRQVMVWVVSGPGELKGSYYWMCYPYVRIIVAR